MAITIISKGKFFPHGNNPGLVIFNINFSAGTNYVVGGLPVDLSGLKLPVNFNDVLQVTCDSNGGHSGWYIPGTNLTNGKFQLFNGTLELTAVALTGVGLVCTMNVGRSIF